MDQPHETRVVARRRVRARTFIAWPSRFQRIVLAHCSLRDTSSSAVPRTTRTEQWARCATRSLTLPSEARPWSAAAADDDQVSLLGSGDERGDRIRLSPLQVVTRTSASISTGLPPSAASTWRSLCSAARSRATPSAASELREPSTPTTIDPEALAVAACDKHGLRCAVEDLACDAAESDRSGATVLMAADRDQVRPVLCGGSEQALGRSLMDKADLGFRHLGRQ